MSRYYDRAGNPLSTEEWIALFKPENQVRQTDVGSVNVSTVWLGLNHRFVDDGPPLIFETMIFGGDHDDDQWRYSTEAEAVAHHEAVVTALKAGEVPPNA